MSCPKYGLVAQASALASWGKCTASEENFEPPPRRRLAVQRIGIQKSDRFAVEDPVRERVPQAQERLASGSVEVPAVRLSAPDVTVQIAHMAGAGGYDTREVIELAGEVGDQIPIGSVLAVIETDGAAAAADESTKEVPIADGAERPTAAQEEAMPTVDVEKSPRPPAGGEEPRSGEGAGESGEALPRPPTPSPEGEGELSSVQSHSLSFTSTGSTSTPCSFASRTICAGA